MRSYNVGDVVCMGDGEKKRFVLNIFTHKVNFFFSYIKYQFEKILIFDILIIVAWIETDISCD